MDISRREKEEFTGIGIEHEILNSRSAFYLVINFCVNFGLEPYIIIIISYNIGWRCHHR